jgi:hypothetical protein
VAKLTFKASKTLSSIAKHTLEANTYSNPYGLYPEMESLIHLDLVKDSGIYLMSGSSKNYKKGKGGGSTVSYAVGYNPVTNPDCWDDARLAVGGDDFAEPIGLEKEQLQRIADGGNIVINITKDSISVRA